MLRLAKKAWSVFRTEGSRAVVDKSRHKVGQWIAITTYRKWLKRYESLESGDQNTLALAAWDLPKRPLISILMPVYNTDEGHLREAIRSVRDQLYDNWELCIADDASTKPYIAPLLKEFSQIDRRIKVAFRDTNGHISAASNTALELVSGAYTALMDHDDLLHATALYFVAKEINDHPDVKIIYTDEDKVTKNGERFFPSFKPGWSPELLFSLNLVTHLIVYKTDRLKACGGFRLGYEGSQDFDLALRVSADLDTSEVRHIPRILYHWRAAAGSVALASEEKPYAHDRAREAITYGLAIRSIPAHAVKGHGELHRIIFDIPQPKPVVTIIGFGGVLQADVIMAKTGGFKCHLVNTGSGLDSRELNAAARDTSAEVLCFLNARTIDVSDNWLDDLVGYTIQQDIGAVGPKIVNGRNRIKHAGYILGIRDGIGRPYAGKRDGATGFFYYLVAARNVSAISLDCLIVSKKVFNEIEGFDSANFIDLYADIDLCLRLRERGYRNVWTPWARIVQEDRSYADDKVLLAQLKRRHQAAFDRDPYYNPNLSLDREFTLAEPPRMEDIT